MALIAYPIAKSASDALVKAKNGTYARAPRQADATKLCQKDVIFCTQFVGPEFEDIKLALDAYHNLVDDEARGFVAAPENRFCKLVARLSDKKQAHLPPAKEIQKEGKRWAKHHKMAPKVWQLSISYWKIASAADSANAQVQARDMRKKTTSDPLSKQELIDMTNQRLMATKPQKALDYGLFDFIPPDNPGIIIADE